MSNSLNDIKPNKRKYIPPHLRRSEGQPLQPQMNKEMKSDEILNDAMLGNIKFGLPVQIVSEYVQDESKHDYLRLVSWNVNMEALSAYTPDGWQYKNNKWDKIYEQVEQQKADIIIFQEISKPYNQYTVYDQDNKIHPLIKKYLDTNKWYITNSTKSHCGHTLILIHKRIAKKYNISSDNIDPHRKWPAVILRKKTKYGYDDSKSVILFGVHLMYGNGSSNQRMLSFDRLYEIAKKKYNIHSNFVLIGDTNMRYYDEQNILNKYKSERISSCWNLVDPKHLKLDAFMATFYRNFFQKGKAGTTRYDKIFCGKNIRFMSLAVFDKSVSKNIPFHFLSDHRGIVADIEIV